jgi:hypothetical protein
VNLKKDAASCLKWVEMDLTHVLLEDLYAKPIAFEDPRVKKPCIQSRARPFTKPFKLGFVRR